jgi:hypothetical protein
MSESYVNQVTLECLLNKQIFSNHIKNQKIKLTNAKDVSFYRKRIYNLFKEMITKNEPNDLLPDVKYAYDNYLNSCINYFKIIDNNDIIQNEYQNMDCSQNSLIPCLENENISNKDAADKLLMRSIKIQPSTLDKYVVKINNKNKNKKHELILPKQKDINLQEPYLKNKGLQKKNITNKYEDTQKEDEKI